MHTSLPSARTAPQRTKNPSTKELVDLILENGHFYTAKYPLFAGTFCGYRWGRLKLELAPCGTVLLYIGKREHMVLQGHLRAVWGFKQTIRTGFEDTDPDIKWRAAVRQRLGDDAKLHARHSQSP